MVDNTLKTPGSWQARLLAVLPQDFRRYKATALGILAFVMALLLSVLAATLIVRGTEHVLERDSSTALAEGGFDWASVQADGLLLTVAGEAATESERFRALGMIGDVVAPERIIDAISVKPAVEISAPRFSLEIMRNGLDVSLVGLVPDGHDIDGLVATLEAIGQEVSVVNMIESAAFPAPFGWDTAVDFALQAVARVPVVKVSAGADQVVIHGLAGSERERDSLRADLVRARPRGLIASIDIAAPRPVITPFTLRFVRDAEGARFDACSADTPEARAAIIQAARRAGATGTVECQIGLGAPSPRWQAAVVTGLQAIADLPAATITFSDTDISLVVPQSVPAEDFEAVVGLLQNRLPDLFSLQSERLAETGGDGGSASGAAEFVASLSVEGDVLLRGRLTDERLRAAVLAMARAEFGLAAVDMLATVNPDTPEGWPVRAMLTVEVLSLLEHGVVRLRPDHFDIRGVTGDLSTSDRISQLMMEKLGQGARFNLNVTYDERFDPVAMQPTPARCEAWLKDVQAREKITFDPGSTRISGAAVDVLDEIAEILRECGRLELEVAGHTDSQGRLETNMRLSQQRAEAVIAALLSRGIPVSTFVAVGYGPEFPIADNATEAGREANRRIEFRLTGDSAAAARAERGEAVSDAPAELPDESDLVVEVIENAPDSARPRPRPEPD